MVWPLEAGTGATPARRAKAASERTRPRCDQAMITSAATIGPTPGSLSNCGASRRTWPRISRFVVGLGSSRPRSARASAAQDELRREGVDPRTANSSGGSRLQRSSSRQFRQRLPVRHGAGPGRSRSRYAAAQKTAGALRSLPVARPARALPGLASLSHPRHRQRVQLARDVQRVQRGSRRADRLCRAVCVRRDGPRPLSITVSPRLLRWRARPAP